MAISEQVRDLDVNPNVTKTVTLDLQSIIPVDNEGDEVYVTSAVTTAVSKITGSANITPIFLREFKAGYSKSSGFQTPPFDIDSSNGNTLRISIDGSSYYSITLTSGSGLSGEDIADDLQTKISALGGSGGAAEGDLGFLNALVEYSENRFKITSGTVSNTYTGVGKSSVLVISGTSDDASSSLGFDIPTESESLSAKQATETQLATSYTSGVVLNVVDVDDYQAGEAFTITDGENREYFVASGIDTGNTEITIAESGLNNTYAAGSIVQRIFERDTTADLASPYEDIDALVRFQLRSIANQIDFTS